MQGLRACLAAVVACLLTATDGAAQAPDDGLRGHGGPVRALAALPDGRTLVSGGFDSAIIVWDMATGSARRVLRGHDGAVQALVAERDGPVPCVWSGGEDGRLARWCGERPVAARMTAAHRGAIAALALSPDGATLASAGWDGEVRLWTTTAAAESTGGEPGRVAAAHKAPVTGVAFTADGRALVSASYDGEVRRTSLDGASQPIQARLPTAINGLAPLRDGGVLLVAADGHLRRLDATLAVTADIELTDGPLTAVVVTPDETTVVVAGLRTPVTLLELARPSPSSSSTERRVILGPGLPVWALALSRDGRQLFTGGADRAVRRWDVATGKALGEPVSPPEPAGGDPAVSGDSKTAGQHPGERVFRACRACHGVTAGDIGRAGPSLFRVFGRRIASAPGYVYSDALKGLDIVWSAETIARLFEVGPSAYTPGTKMPEQRITDPVDRAALIEWLAIATKP